MGIIKSLPARALPLSIVLLISNQGHANEIFGGAISANSLVSDNTTKTALEPIEERQDTYQAGITADYTNWLIEAEADYQLYAKQFAEKSQADEEYVDGSASLVFGKEQEPFGLELNHSRRMLLQSPEAVGLVENMDEREIISAAPIMRARIFGSDMLFLQGQVSQVKFLDDDSRDSKRNAISFGWAHPVSQTDILQFAIQQIDVKFDQQPEFDYALANAMLSYAVQLRKLNYRVEAGVNESSPETGEKERSPAYKVELEYISGYNNFSASFSQRLTDTSFGDGNDYGSSEIPSGDGLTLSLKRIDRKTADVSWSTDFICARCSFSIGASFEDDNYLESDETSRNLYTRSAFTYSLSSAASLKFSADRSKYDFDGGEVTDDYFIDYLAAEYSYRFLNNINIRFFVRKEERDSDSIESSYEENMYGAGLGYFFQ